jgi:hypothetical protein
MEDILDDEKLAECSAAACWLFIGLLAACNRMKSRDGEITIPIRSVNAIAHTRDWSGTRPRLDALTEARVLSYERTGKSLRLSIPKWAKHQGFTPAELRRDSVETPSPTPTPTPTPKKKDTVAPRGAPPGGTSSPGSNGKIPPEAFLRVDALSKAILESVPGQRTPKTAAEKTKAAVIIDRLHRLDGQPWETIDEVIAWLPTHERPGFRWGLVVLSARKFRAHFPRMLAEKRAPPSRSWAQKQVDENDAFFEGLSDE